MKNKNNNESNTKSELNNSNNLNKDFEKNISEFKERINRPGNLIEYFAIIGLDPKIASKNFLYELSPSNITEFYSNKLKPKLITKYPPINKSYINIDENICELCFPNGIKLEKYKTQPEPVIYRFLLGNDYYSIEHPIKYMTCLKFFESLNQYKILQKRLIEEKLEDNNNINNMSFDNINVKDLLNELNDGKKEININKRNKSQKIKIYKKNKYNMNNIKSEFDLNCLFVPKIICFISLKPQYKIHEKILYQLYNYYNLKEIKVPIEKIIINILCNIPLPPRGIHTYQYTMNKDFKKIEIKSEQMNKIKNYDDDLKIIFHYFNIDNFLEIFRYTLFETKTVVFSSNINHLCSLINGLISILYPFIYPFQVSSCLREDAFEVLESISPYIIGINQKYKNDFFSNNKIETKNTNFLIIDLDNKDYFINTVEELPSIPKGILKKLRMKLDMNLNKFRASVKHNINEDDEENIITFAFFEFFLNILYNYSTFLNNENLKENFKITNLNILFKLKEFIDSHSSSERPFYKRLTETQMFNDFIFKKMIPKDINDKLDLLLFDENINKINNKKIFKKTKSTLFISSKEYNFKSVHKIPKAKELLEEELIKYKNKNYLRKNLLRGQDIIFEKNSYFFNYILFPKFNNDFYNYPSNEFFSYYYNTDNIKNDLKRVNTDLLAKSLINNGGNNTLLNEGEGMIDYIYLTYIEVWGYSYWYQDLSERDYRFTQLLNVLDKIRRQEIELFNILFGMLNKFHEKEKIKKLYYKILEYKLTPNSFIYSIVGKSIKKDSEGLINDELYLGKIEEKINFQKRTFKSENDINILGDNIHFDNFQECQECSKIINIETICKDYKKMKRDLLWAQCPLCLNYIKPQIAVTIGEEIFPGMKNFSLSKKEFFTLYSPYELKNSIKNIIENEQFELLNIDKFKIKFPNVFWNCIWYFDLYNLDYTIILPYEFNIYKKIPTNSGINTPFIVAQICPVKNDNKDNNNDIKINVVNVVNEDKNKNEIVIDANSKKFEKKKFKNKQIIHNNISFQYILLKSKKRPMGEFFDSIKSKNKYKTPTKVGNNNQDIDKYKNDEFNTTSKKNIDK